MSIYEKSNIEEKESLEHFLLLLTINLVPCKGCGFIFRRDNIESLTVTEIDKKTFVKNVHSN